MSEYKVIANDTFEIISRKVYGVEIEAGLIARANPGVFEPLTEGIVIIIPDRPDASQIITAQAPSISKNEIALSIEDKRFRFWERFNRKPKVRKIPRTG